MVIQYNRWDCPMDLTLAHTTKTALLIHSHIYYEMGGTVSQTL